MLVSAEEMLKKAKAGKYAVGQFNINSQNCSIKMKKSIASQFNT